MTSPATPTDPYLPSAAPTWLVHAIGVAAAVAGVVLAVWHPNKAFTGPAAQAAVFVAGFAVYAVLAAVHIVSRNGLTKAGLARSVTEEEAWIRANINDIRSAFDSARGIVASVDPQLVTRTASDVEALKAKVADVPVADRQTIEDTVRSLVIPQVLTASQPSMGSAVSVTPASPAVTADPTGTVAP